MGFPVLFITPTAVIGGKEAAHFLRTLHPTLKEFVASARSL